MILYFATSILTRNNFSFSLTGVNVTDDALEKENIRIQLTHVVHAFDIRVFEYPRLLRGTAM
jgi:hypothetical protein